ncbi:MAG: hypothetical protein JWM46_542 [Candidatus Kaiserbacteria bacterium]|nr:hypothetical protein [Candidatus Kaiserbacteria bacterium]
MDTNQRNTQIAIGVAVIVVVGLLAWWLFSKPAASTGTMATSTGTSITTDTTGTAASETDLSGSGNTVSSSGEALSVGDQPAGDSVRVASVTLAKAGWVAVRDSMRIYGAAWLTAGTHENVSVPLLRNTVSGSNYTAVLYADNGDKKFDMHADALVTGVSDTFSATNGD